MCYTKANLSRKVVWVRMNRGPRGNHWRYRESWTTLAFALIRRSEKVPVSRTPIVPSATDRSLVDLTLSNTLRTTNCWTTSRNDPRMTFRLPGACFASSRVTIDRGSLTSIVPLARAPRSRQAGQPRPGNRPQDTSLTVSLFARSVFYDIVEV